MATVTYTIYSHYDPKDSEQLEQETIQILDETEEDASEAWDKAASSLVTRSRAIVAPKFVPASTSHKNLDLSHASVPSYAGLVHATDEPETSLAGWYRSLTSNRYEGGSESKRLLVSESLQADSTCPEQQKVESRNKNNWFIMKALNSEPPSTTRPPTSSLADILERDPPPLLSERKFQPPVFLALGPANKGFNMLQRSGWNEGEGLGLHTLRRDPFNPDLMDDDRPRKRRITEICQEKLRVKNEEVLVPLGEGISEVKNVETIDLTLSDSDPDDSDRELEDAAVDATVPGEVSMEKDQSPYAPKALLTPIATVLKSDRLGIGLKAKTVGPHKASQKRITHNAAALAAHVRRSEEQRKEKAQVGRGTRGLDRLRKKEERKRQQLLAYMNG